jgi:hypothetical protein
MVPVYLRIVQENASSWHVPEFLVEDSGILGSKKLVHDEIVPDAEEPAPRKLNVPSVKLATCVTTVGDALTNLYGRNGSFDLRSRGFHLKSRVD